MIDLSCFLNNPYVNSDINVIDVERDDEAYTECPEWYECLPQTHKEHIGNIILQYKKPNGELEYRLMDETHMNIADIRILLRWWFSVRDTITFPWQKRKFPRNNAKHIQWLNKCNHCYIRVEDIRRLKTFLEFTYENSLLHEDANHRRTLQDEARRLLAKAYKDLEDVGPVLKAIQEEVKKQEMKEPYATYTQAIAVQYQRCAGMLQMVMTEIQCVQIDGKAEQRKQIKEKALLVRNDLTENQLDQIMKANDPHLLLQKMETVQLEHILEAQRRAKKSESNCNQD